MTSILFLCKFNKFRSQVAEAYFNQINKNKTFKASSAGFIIPFSKSLQEDQVRVAKQNGVKMKGKSKSLTSKMLKEADIAVIAADDIPRGMVVGKKYNKKLIYWKIPDAHHDDEKSISRSVNLIKKKVEKLVKRLK